MSTSNVNFSINNLPKIDHHLNDTLKAPNVNQTQNAEIAKNETIHKLMMPVEVSRTEQEIADFKDLKKNHTKKLKQIKKQQKKSNSKKKKQKNNGFFVDLEG